MQPDTTLTIGESGRIVDVRDGDALVLSTGLSVRLAEIEAPRMGWKDRPADAYGEESARVLEIAALGRQAQLSYGGLTRDRYDRAIAHVTVQDETGGKLWLNGYLARQGAARVRTWADNATRVRELYLLENEARTAGVGLWSMDAYRILSPLELDDAGRGLKIVEGVVGAVRENGQPYSYMTASSETGMVLSIGLGMARSRDRMNIEPSDRIRLRGGLRTDENRDTRLKLDHWGQIEVLNNA